MNDDHPAEQVRVVMAELDAPPPPDPPPAPVPPKPRPVVVIPPPQRMTLWDVLRLLAPVLGVVALIVFAVGLYYFTH